MRHIEALVAQLVLPTNREEGRPGNDDKLLDFLQLQDSFEWNGIYHIYISYNSVPKAASMFGSAYIQGDERTDNAPVIVYTGFDAGPVTPASSESAPVRERATHDSTPA